MEYNNISYINKELIYMIYLHIALNFSLLKYILSPLLNQTMTKRGKNISCFTI